MSPLSVYAEIARAYVRWAPLLIALALIVFIPLGLIHAIPVHAELHSLDFRGWLQLFAVLIAVLTLVITGLLGEVFYTGAVTISLTHSGDGGPPSLREIAAMIAYRRLIAVDVIYGAAVAIGLILLVAPGVAAFVWLALAAPIVEMENRGVRDAFARSMRLIRGHFWPVLAVLAPIQLAGSGVTYLASEVAHALLGDAFVSEWLAEVLANVALAPFFAVAAVLLTVRLIGEKEPERARLDSVAIR